jgi:hypothetical protein
VSYTAGKGPNGIAIGDLNGDGIADVVTANESGNTISVLLGIGGGKLGHQTLYVVGTNPDSVALGDFNGDGALDIAVTNYGSANASVLLNSGNGKFAAAVNYSAVQSPYQIVTADFNGDGVLDLAVAGFDDMVSVLLGNGNGTFKTGVIYQTNQTETVGLGVGDFNHDGILDLITIDFGSDTVDLFIGNGDGTFQTPYSYAVGFRPNAIGLGDLNGDGVPDVIAANNFSPTSSGIITVVLGNGDGTLRAGRAYFASNPTIGNSIGTVSAADLNRDGILDLVTANGGSTNNLGVLLGNGDGTFKAAANFPAGAILSGCAVLGDFNGDKLTDAVVVDKGNAAIDFLPGNGDGTFGPPTSYAAGNFPNCITAGDFNKDGKLDVALTIWSGGSTGFGSLNELFGNGDGSFQSPNNYDLSGGFPEYLQPGDMNGDGQLDLVVAVNGTVGFPGANVLLNQGGGMFAPEVNYLTASQPAGIAIGDFNRDGKLDFVASNITSNNVSVFLNQGNGLFGNAVNYGAGLQRRGDD